MTYSRDLSWPALLSLHVPGTQFLGAGIQEQLSFIYSSKSFHYVMTAITWRLIMLVSLSLILGARKMVLLYTCLRLLPFRMLLAGKVLFQRLFYQI